MLILTRKSGESITIGDDVKIQVIEIKGKQVRIGIEAPRNYVIHREEVYIRIQEENKRAAEKSPVSLKNLRDLLARGRKAITCFNKMYFQKSNPTTQLLGQ